MNAVTAPMTDEQLNSLLEGIADGMETLEQQSETYGGTARTLWLALAMQLADAGTLSHLVGASNWAVEQLEEKAAH